MQGQIKTFFSAIKYRAINFTCPDNISPKKRKNAIESNRSMECMDRITFGRFSLFLPHRPPYLLHLDGIYKQNRIACVCKWQAQHIHIEVFIQPFLCSSCLHLFHSYRFVHHTEFAVFSCALFRINKRILGAGLFGFRIRVIRPKKSIHFHRILLCSLYKWQLLASINL